MEAASAAIQLQQAVRFGVRDRAQQHRVDDAEHRRVGADAERQGDHRHQRESRRFQQCPDAVAHVLQQVLHSSSTLRRQRLAFSGLDGWLVPGVLGRDVSVLPPGRRRVSTAIDGRLASRASTVKETGTALEKLDHVMLRGYLVDAGYLCRPADGSSYRVVADPPGRPRCEAGVADVDLADLLQARREEVASLAVPRGNPAMVPEGRNHDQPWRAYFCLSTSDRSRTQAASRAFLSASDPLGSAPLRMKPCPAPS